MSYLEARKQQPLPYAVIVHSKPVGSSQKRQIPPNTFASCTLPVKAPPLVGPKTANLCSTYCRPPQIIPSTAAPTAPMAPAIKNCGAGVAAATPSESLVLSPVCLALDDSPESPPVALRLMTTGPVTPAEFKALARDVTAGGSVVCERMNHTLQYNFSPTRPRLFTVLTIAVS
ncbi:uncharacterized protein MYCFIDRAFT_194919 [Pseudocercospora fijiensis CIRAD86]|uniref:Uncharacterized protein n=1 Tax=Pseudocercospora fijiensis (strain CIRAD86) TaxID=383855 RepID=M3BCM1_PSEFD|nr:uncharacterized protein MYCFIDRAFT_194919 [Pseudocercospora fijiensis CIRAD86]EME87027.1 hypothetical protein MYCFIDRAFT_194919 [Pseudocercospora fijiensis CIRAD86]